MQVRSGTTIKGRVIEVTLDSSDGLQHVKGWSELAMDAQFRALSRRADVLVVQYLSHEGLVTKEWARQRIKEIIDAD